MGGLFSKLFKSLKPSIFARREETHSIDRTRSDHPERLPVDQAVPVTNLDDLTPDSPSPSQLSRESIASGSSNIRLAQRCSDFYLACRNSRVEEVKAMLKTISQDEKDRLEPNGSTALHAAAYHGHLEIVRLLLESGVDRSIQNKFHCLPFDEAATEEIKELFLRIPNGNRLVMDIGAIQWELIGSDALENAVLERDASKNIYNNTTGTTSVLKMFEKIQQNYIEKRLANTEKIDTIKHFFERATREQDPIWIIKAYTAETDFYNVLNAEIASGVSMYQNERKFIIALLSQHPSLDHLSYVGVSYRVMKMSDYDFQNYEIGQLSMTKSFLSSSIKEEIAVWFLSRQESTQEDEVVNTRFSRQGGPIKSWIMCKYLIKHRRSALHIEKSSQYPLEEEVLIMPYTVFKINDKRKVTTSYLPDDQLITEIEFEEYSSMDESSEIWTLL